MGTGELSHLFTSGPATGILDVLPLCDTLGTVPAAGVLSWPWGWVLAGDRGACGDRDLWNTFVNKTQSSLKPGSLVCWPLGMPCVPQLLPAFPHSHARWSVHTLRLPPGQTGGEEGQEV